jgi:hypothetical protein
MRAAEELLESNLGVAGFRTQVLERIEEMEAREGEREGLLAELAALEERGYGTGALRVESAWRSHNIAAATSALTKCAFRRSSARAGAPIARPWLGWDTGLYTSSNGERASRFTGENEWGTHA